MASPDFPINSLFPLLPSVQYSLIYRTFEKTECSGCMSVSPPASSSNTVSQSQAALNQGLNGIHALSGT